MRSSATRFNVCDAIVLGAAGDSQLATTAEGFLTVPFVADYARSAARRIPDDLLCDELRGQPTYARPVPCYVLLRPATELARWRPAEPSNHARTGPS